MSDFLIITFFSALPFIHANSLLWLRDHGSPQPLLFVALCNVRFPYYTSFLCSAMNSYKLIFSLRVHGTPQFFVVCSSKQCPIASLFHLDLALPPNSLGWLRDHGSPQLSVPCFY